MATSKEHNVQVETSNKLVSLKGPYRDQCY